MTFWNQAAFQFELTKDDGPGLRVFHDDGMEESDLVRSQTGMLLNNVIPGVVPFRLVRINGNYTFQYSLIGLRKFSASIQTKPPVHAHWEGMLHALRNVLLRGNDYLLHRNGFVLHPDWMWVTKDARDLQLLYIPARSFVELTLPWDQWNTMVAFFKKNGMPQSLLTAIDPVQWDKETFDHSLWMTRLETQLKSEENILEMDREIDERIISQDQPLKSRSAPPRSDVIGAPIALDDEGETMRFSTSIVSMKEALAVGIAGCGWGAFLWMQTEIWLLIACVASVPIGYIGWTRGIARLKKREDDEKSEVHANHWEERTDLHESAQPLSMRTTLLTAQQETVYLSNYADSRVFAKEAPWLQVHKEGSEEKEVVYLTEFPFIIGREASLAHLQIDHIAVSRRHLEIEKTSMGYEVRDAGSRNGTFRNEQVLNPMEWVTLQPGDLLRLPGAEVVFQPKIEP